jgi:hypothetical protein
MQAKLKEMLLVLSPTTDGLQKTSELGKILKSMGYDYMCTQEGLEEVIKQIGRTDGKIRDEDLI